MKATKAPRHQVRKNRILGVLVLENAIGANLRYLRSSTVALVAIGSKSEIDSYLKRIVPIVRPG
jgi:hypothetical protein